MSDKLTITVDEDGHLLCPNCGSDFVHVDMVEVYGRDNEDGPTRAVAVDASGSTVTTYPCDHNPSARRHAIRIAGWCETCDVSPFSVTFVQHKGQTTVEVKVSETQ